MPEEWIVLVEGREYGPVDLPGLREWKGEGRVVSTNQARRAEDNVWIQAAEIPGLFDSLITSGDALLAPASVPRSFSEVLRATFRIYRKGFRQFLCLTLLVVIPSVCAQVTGAMLDTSSAVDADVRTLLA